MKLDPIKYKLEKDPLCGVQITDLDTNNRLLPVRFYNEIVEKYGSFDNMLQTFYNNGVTRLSVQEYRKSGNALVKKGNPIPVEAIVETPEPVEQKQVLQYEHQPLNRPMVHNAIPISIEEKSKLDINSYIAVELKAENKWLKEKIELLEKTNAEQRETILEHRFNERALERELETKKANNDFNLGMIQQLAPTVGPALAGMFSKGSSVPLGQPVQQQKTYSEQKQKLITTIEDNNFSNAMAVFIDDLIYKLHFDENFYNDLSSLIEKYNSPNEN